MHGTFHSMGIRNECRGGISEIMLPIFQGSRGTEEIPGLSPIYLLSCNHAEC